MGAFVNGVLVAILCSSAVAQDVHARAQPQEEFIVAVIGQSGVGKSTIQTAWARSDNIGPPPKKPIFPEHSGAGSGTQEVMRKSFAQKLDGRPIKLTLIDTMGFPDPDRKKAAKYYDKVVEAVSAPVNAVVWVVKCDRQLSSDLKRYSIMMKEFVSLKVPLIMLVNNRGYYDEDEEDKREEDRRHCRMLAEEMEQQTDLKFTVIIVSAEKNELRSRVKQQMALYLGSTKPKSSELRTYASLMTTCKLAKDKKVGYEESLREQHVKLSAVNRNINFQNDRRNEVHKIEKYYDVEHVQHDKHGNVENRWQERRTYVEDVRTHSDQAINAEVAKLSDEKSAITAVLERLKSDHAYASKEAARVEQQYNELRRALEL